MRAVSNTSPLSNLAIIERLDLLKQRYGIVHVPPAVAAELSRLTHVPAQARLTAAFAQGWLILEELPDSPIPPPASLDPGETEAALISPNELNYYGSTAR